MISSGYGFHDLAGVIRPLRVSACGNLNDVAVLARLQCAECGPSWSAMEHTPTIKSRPVSQSIVWLCRRSLHQPDSHCRGPCHRYKCFLENPDTRSSIQPGLRAPQQGKLQKLSAKIALFETEQSQLSHKTAFGMPAEQSYGESNETALAKARETTARCPFCVGSRHKTTARCSFLPVPACI